MLLSALDAGYLRAFVCGHSSATVCFVTRRLAEVRLDLLLRTACEVIARHGLANTRTADVAKAAGVSQALVFYHFTTKERLLAQAFAYATEQDLARVEALDRAAGAPIEKLRRLVKLYAPSGRTKSWSIWIDGWAEAMRVPEVEKLSRRRVLRWREALEKVIADGVQDGSFKCDDPSGAAWRIASLIDGLAVQAGAHPRILSRSQMTEWVHLTTARELDLRPEQLS